jgi:hypothetical protein
VPGVRQTARGQQPPVCPKCHAATDRFVFKTPSAGDEKRRRTEQLASFFGGRTQVIDGNRGLPGPKPDGQRARNRYPAPASAARPVSRGAGRCEYCWQRLSPRLRLRQPGHPLQISSYHLNL